jgi:RimJ/RimL family protein N-acetyltransferase
VTQPLIVRPITGPDELDLFNRLPYLLNHQLADDLAAGRRRTEWLWVALKGDHLVARAGWWALAGDDEPFLMDIFDVGGDPEDGRALLAQALPKMGKREYLRFLPTDGPFTGTWRTALESEGARVLVERRRLEWRPGTPIAPPTGRLRFRPIVGPDELIDLMTRVLDGTLDVHSQADLKRQTPRAVAEEQFHEELERYTSPREWWRIAERPSGEPVGFVIPARNDYNPIIAYIGVVPEMRGNGYIDDILAEGTRILASLGVPRIRADTDIGNTPMEAAFARAGYVTFQRRIDMTWPS